ncbi:MAG: ATP-binding cassette domain-containing protein, partial [Rhodobiaceae bacterium]
MSSNFTLRDIHQSFQQADRDLHVLRGVNLDIQAGEIVALLGPSGSGKSTLLGILAGLDLPSGGSVSLDGQDITAMDEEGRAAVRA